MVSLRSFKLRFADDHVRIVPKTDSTGCPFSGPGVDVRGAEARAIFAAAAPLVAVLRSLEPGVAVRSIAVDLERPRVTATLDPTLPDADPRARVARLDEGAVLHRLIAEAAPVVALLEGAASAALAARAEAAR